MKPKYNSDDNNNKHHIITNKVKVFIKLYKSSKFHTWNPHVVFGTTL